MYLQSNNNLQTMFNDYIESQKSQQAQLAEQAKSVNNSAVREYLEASNQVMNQLNQLDEFVLSSATKQKKQTFFEKIKNVFKKMF